MCEQQCRDTCTEVCQNTVHAACIRIACHFVPLTCLPFRRGEINNGSRRLERHNGVTMTCTHAPMHNTERAHEEVRVMLCDGNRMSTALCLSFVKHACIVRMSL
jgi:hypothetical protein